MAASLADWADSSLPAADFLFSSACSDSLAFSSDALLLAALALASVSEVAAAVSESFAAASLALAWLSESAAQVSEEQADENRILNWRRPLRWHWHW